MNVTDFVQVFSVDIYDDEKECGIDTRETMTLYGSLDDAITAAKIARGRYPECIVSIIFGEYEDGKGNVLGDPTVLSLSDLGI